jgi:hypothetical protein
MYLALYFHSINCLIFYGAKIDVVKNPEYDLYYFKA